MHFEFSKQVHPRYSVEGFGILENWRHITIQQQDKLIGEFYLHPKVCYFDVEGRELRIDIKRHVFKKDKASIVDRKTNEIIGDYWTKGEQGHMRLGESSYMAHEQKADIAYSLWKRNTWGHYKFRVYSDTEEVVYTWRQTGSGRYHLIPFVDGKIYLSQNNALLLCAGIYLLEEFLAYKDDRSG